ncbi:MAG: thioredoxin family protein [Ruminococcaceae bacterium]|nr:thioredoxin family protein [Oscillospiraceae bacterium]
MRPIRIGYLNYESFLSKDKCPAMLVFGAVWDAQSRNLFSDLDYYAKKYDKKIRIGFVEYEYASDIFTENNITKLPTVIIFEDGKPFKTLEGTCSRDTVESFIRHFFGFYP